MGGCLFFSYGKKKRMGTIFSEVQIYLIFTQATIALALF